MYLLVGSMGLKLCGAGEWLLEKHGTKTRRAWRTLHIGTDADTGHIVAATLTGSDTSQVGPLLDQVDGPVASFTADGAYDWDSVHSDVAAHHPRRRGRAHTLVVAGSGGYKTTSVAVPTLLTWTGSAVVLDPSREVAPMVILLAKSVWVWQEGGPSLCGA